MSVQVVVQETTTNNNLQRPVNDYADGATLPNYKIESINPVIKLFNLQVKVWNK